MCVVIDEFSWRGLILNLALQYSHRTKHHFRCADVDWPFVQCKFSGPKEEAFSSTSKAAQYQHNGAKVRSITKGQPEYMKTDQELTARLATKEICQLLFDELCSLTPYETLLSAAPFPRHSSFLICEECRFSMLGLGLFRIKRLVVEVEYLAHAW